MAAQQSKRGLKKIVRDRLMDEMITETVKDMAEEEWAVLIVDDITTKVVSEGCSVSDLVEKRFSLVESLDKKRQPLPNMTVLYYISPTKESVSKLIADFSAKNPMYRKAYVYFSTSLPKEQLDRIKQSPALIARLGALKELNLEFLAVDSRAFVTSTEKNLKDIFGERSKLSGTYDQELNLIVKRLATMFASMKEYPAIRFKAAKPPQEGEPVGASERSLIAQRVAVSLYSKLSDMRGTVESFPASETCELVILDRGIDPIAPVMHEWTYECMCYDLLDVGNNNILKYSVGTNSGKEEEREVILGEHDPIWLELRHKHIAEASLILNEKMEYFKKANKVAQHKTREQSNDSIDTGDLRQMVESLPQYREQLKCLSLHIYIATTLNSKAKSLGLHDIGRLEQDLVYGNATSKEVIKLLGAHPMLSNNEKVRLLMCYVATHPEKLDNARRMQWMKLTKLGVEDMNVINNLEYLGVSVSKKGSTSKLNFGAKKRKRPVRKEHDAEEGEEQWQLSRFQPILYDICEDMLKGELSQDEYPYVSPPSITSEKKNTQINVELSVRKNRSTTTRKTTEGLANLNLTDVNIQAKPLIVFIVGGATRSELRVAHKMSAQYSSNIIVGSTSIDTPDDFLHQLNQLSELNLSM